MSDIVLVAIITAMPSTIAAITSYLTHLKVDEVRKEVNGQMQNLVRTTGEAEKAKGVLEGITIGEEKKK